MDESLILLIILSLCLGAACWLVFIWAVKKRQFDDVERPIHRMLDDDGPEQGFSFAALFVTLHEN